MDPVFVFRVLKVFISENRDLMSRDWSKNLLYDERLENLNLFQNEKQPFLCRTELLFGEDTKPFRREQKCLGPPTAWRMKVEVRIHDWKPRALKAFGWSSQRKVKNKLCWEPCLHCDNVLQCWTMRVDCQQVRSTGAHPLIRLGSLHWEFCNFDFFSLVLSHLVHYWLAGVSRSVCASFTLLCSVTFVNMLIWFNKLP